MSLSDLGNLGEFLGAVAVVVSLLYLAAQVRQNSALQRASIVQAVSAATAASLSQLGRDGETARLVMRGLANDPPLSDEEQFQFNVLLFTVFNACQNAFYLHQSGMAPDDLWTRYTGVIRFYMANPGAREWWDRSVDRIGPSFVDWVERHVLRDFR